LSDPELALTLAAGVPLGLGQLLHEEPERDAADASDRLAENPLRIYGIPADDANKICRRPHLLTSTCSWNLHRLTNQLGS
jgi:hypothetical protein